MVLDALQSKRLSRMDNARDWITSLSKYRYIVVYPGSVLVLFILGWNLLGDTVSDIMDPRLRKMQEGK